LPLVEHQCPRSSALILNFVELKVSVHKKLFAGFWSMTGFLGLVSARGPPRSSRAPCCGVAMRTETVGHPPATLQTLIALIKGSSPCLTWSIIHPTFDVRFMPVVVFFVHNPSQPSGRVRLGHIYESIRDEGHKGEPVVYPTEGSVARTCSRIGKYVPREHALIDNFPLSLITFQRVTETKVNWKFIESGSLIVPATYINDSELRSIRVQDGF
jgi:hypothetical protein